MSTPQDSALSSAPASPSSPSSSPPSPAALDAEALYPALLQGVRALLTASSLNTESKTRPHLVGIASGGVWLADRLQADLKDLVAAGQLGDQGVISSTMHRDDFAQRGLSSNAQTTLPFDVDGADLILVDDVLYTGRTLRAVLNELFDYGRPRRVRLAVLVDRGGRQLPIQADVVAASLNLHAELSLRFLRDEAGRFSFSFNSGVQ